MSEPRYIQLGSNLIELQKSTLPAGLADESGTYPFFCSSADPKAIDQWLVDGEAVVLGTGGVASVNFGQGRFAYSTDCWAIQARKGELSTEYLYRTLQHLLPRIDYAGFEGSGLRHLRKDFVRNLRVTAPDEDAQARVTEVLAAVDDAIAQTEALIAKTQQIKAGLMHDLFTRGVTADGQLRPAREQAPELYQESPLGWIPIEWSVENLESLLAPVPNNIRSGPFGSALLKHELVEDGIPLLGIDNIHVERFVPNFQRYVGERKFLELSKYRVRPRDVVITIMGTIGRCCVIPDDLELALSSKHLWTMTFDQEKVLPELVCWQLNHSAWVSSWFRRGMQGGIMDAIQSSTLKTLKLPTPSVEEQKLILERYLGVVSAITSSAEQLAKLNSQKSGLMHDLLNGHVTVQAI